LASADIEVTHHENIVWESLQSRVGEQQIASYEQPFTEFGDRAFDEIEITVDNHLRRQALEARSSEIEIARDLKPL
jgi:hypothetical protein